MIDLNCDLGESSERIADGTEGEILRYVTSVNVACGAHAGDDATMEATVRAALRHGRAIGAHPSYPDREHFGRRALALPPDEVSRTVHDQVARLAVIAARCGAALSHVKPHGALYNQAAHDERLARAVAEGVARFDPGLLLVGLCGSPALEIYARAGFRVLGEAFADRSYESDGRLRSRDLPRAVLTDPEEAAAQALSIARDGVVTAFDGTPLLIAPGTLCLHGDTPGAARIAAAVAARLRAAGIVIAPPAKPASRTPA